jgi:phosphoribosyl 1,2-cyclic phosphodiesterase
VATPGPSTLRCGGNTACVEVRCGSRVIILDAGTGIRELGLQLEAEGVTEVDLLISHGHMDHLQGFPFFNPAYNAGTRINVYLSHPGVHPLHKLMEAPYFPVPFESLGADIQFHEMNGRRRLGEVEVRSHPLNHPGGSTAFRLEYRGKTLIYFTDHEPYGGPRDQAARDFTAGADLLIREAQYTAAEYELKRGWGHSRFDDAVSDAIAADVASLALFHHDPQHDDQFLERELSDLRSRYASSALEICLAREGQSIELA